MPGSTPSLRAVRHALKATKVATGRREWLSTNDIVQVDSSTPQGQVASAYSVVLISQPFRSDCCWYPEISPHGCVNILQLLGRTPRDDLSLLSSYSTQGAINGHRSLMLILRDQDGTSIGSLNADLLPVRRQRVA